MRTTAPGARLVFEIQTLKGFQQARRVRDATGKLVQASAFNIGQPLPAMPSRFVIPTTARMGAFQKS